MTLRPFYTVASAIFRDFPRAPDEDWYRGRPFHGALDNDGGCGTWQTFLSLVPLVETLEKFLTYDYVNYIMSFVNKTKNLQINHVRFYLESYFHFV